MDKQGLDEARNISESSSITFCGKCCFCFLFSGMGNGVLWSGGLRKSRAIAYIIFNVLFFLFPSFLEKEGVISGSAGPHIYQPTKGRTRKGGWSLFLLFDLFGLSFLVCPLFPRSFFLLDRQDFFVFILLLFYSYCYPEWLDECLVHVFRKYQDVSVCVPHIRSEIK
ncbi:hypothetical protein QBC43DRAFT_84273 [Cladorrhinum sp. PSN259]|nr:hypothetical protein QBC43DRAFT_84273 [Cladorrhinum sp. PSN259]